MKALVLDSYNGPDACHFGDLPRPVPAADELLIRVHAASVNPWDLELSWGKPWITRLLAGGMTRPRRIQALGCDIAGIVEVVGEKVTGFRRGDRVMADNSGSHWGGYAELALAKAAECAPIPQGLAMTEAASLPQAGVLALQGLRDYGDYENAQTVLINGAGGGVGPIALQLARNAGAEVHAIDSVEKLDALSALGAARVFDYRTHDFSRAGYRYDLILDTVQRHSGWRCRHALTRRGTYVVIGGNLRHAFGVFVTSPIQPLLGRRRQKILIHRPNGRDLGELAAMVVHGAFRPVVARTYPFAQAREALKANGRGEGIGKLVIVVA